MEQRCVWFFLWIRNCLVKDWFDCCHYRTFAAAKRYAERVLDKYPGMSSEFKFEKVVFFNGSIVEREFIA